MQHWEKTRDYFINIQPKFFHMLYKHNDLLINFDATLPTSYRIRIKCIQNSSRMLLETCITHSFNTLPRIYWLLQRKTWKAFSSNNRNEPK